MFPILRAPGSVVGNSCGTIPANAVRLLGHRAPLNPHKSWNATQMETTSQWPAAFLLCLPESSYLSGMLVVNVTWRNKTYVGTLLDYTRHDWAPTRGKHATAFCLC